MRINHNNPNLQLQNILGMEQAARKEAQEKAAESAKAHATEEALRLQEIANSMKQIKVEGKKNQEESQKKGYRNARYRPDGTVEADGSEAETPSHLPPSGGIDLRA